MRIIQLFLLITVLQCAKGQVFKGIKVHRLENVASMQFASNNFKDAAPNFYTASKLREEQLKFELSELDLYFAGESYLEQNKWDSALFCNNKITDSLKPSIQTDSVFLFKTLLQRASILTQIDSLDKAYEILTQLEENKSIMTDSLLISRIYYCLGQYYYSKELYKETVRASTNSFTYLPNNYINNYYLSKIKLLLGAANKMLSNFTLSENLLLEARQLTQNLPYSELLTARINNKLGSLYYTIDDNIRAKKFLFEAETFFNSENSVDINDLISNQILLSMVFELEGDKKKALQINFEMLHLIEEFYGKNNMLTKMPLHCIGNIYNSLGNYNKALKYLNQSLDIYNSYKKEDYYDKAIITNSIALCNSSLGNYAEAIVKHKQAISIIEKNYGNIHISIAINYHNIGLNYILTNQYDSALFYINSSFNQAKSLFGPNSPKFAYSYNALAETYTKMNLLDSALYYNRTSLKIYTSQFGKQHPQVSIKYVDIARIYLSQSQPEIAIYYFDSALYSNGLTKDLYSSILFGENNQNLSNLSILYPKKFTQSLMGLSKAKFELYKLKKDEIYLKESARLYNKTFVSIQLFKSDFNSEKSLLSINEMLKDDIGEVLEVDYELYTKGLIDSLDGVHQHIETIKKSALYSVLSSKRYNEGDSITRIIFAENQLYSLYEQKNLKLLLMNSEAKKNDSIASKLRSELFNISRSLDSIYSIYKTKFPTYAELRFGDKSITLNELKSSLKADEAVLNYFSTKNSIFVFVVTNKKQQFIKLSPNLSLSDSIQIYNKSLKQFSFNEVNRLNHYLYGVLIHPIYDFIKGCNNLVIIPDESLSILPFETLSKTPITELDYKNANYLVHDFSVSYHYNATLWNLGLNSTESSYTKEFAGFAPIFKGNSQTLAELEDYLINEPKNIDLIYRSGDKFYVTELPFSGEEIEGIGNLFEKSGFTADKFLNLNASETTFKSTSSSYRYLHIATHGLVNYDFPQLSGLLFAQNHLSNLEEDGILYAGEISNLALNTNLVVLSSCESGIGKLIKGEGMLSMSRFFYCAGVPNIMFSLWKVPDNSTNKLMIEFYTNLLNNSSKPNALRNAKLKLIENPEYSFPQFWGGFVLLGN